MEEIWKPIKGWEGMYLVSNLGRVKSIDRLSPKKYKRNGRVLAQTKCHGYWCVTFFRGSFFTRRVHRLVAEAFIPNPENKPYVNHIDCNRGNSKVGNLEWCTPSENMLHSHMSGKRKRKSGGKVINNDTGEVYDCVSDIVKYFPEKNLQQVYYAVKNKKCNYSIIKN